MNRIKRRLKNSKNNFVDYLSSLFNTKFLLKGKKRRTTKTPLSAQLLFSKVIIVIVSISAFLFFLCFLIIPTTTIIKSAFIGKKGFTLGYIKLLFKRKLFFSSLANSLKIGIATTFFATLVASPLALINNKFNYRGKQLLSSLIIISMFIPPFVGGIGITHFFSTYGTINTLLMNLNIIHTRIAFLNSGSIIPIVFIQTLHLYPIMYLNLSSTLANIDPSVEEAGITLGIGRFRCYKDIVWPLARPGFFSGTILIFIWAFTDLGTPLMTNFTNVLSVNIFKEINEINDNPYAYAMVFFMMFTTILFAALLRLVLAVDNRHKMLAKNYVKRVMHRPSSLQKWGIYGIFLSIIFISLIPHIGVLITSVSARWYNTYLPDRYTLDAYTSLFSGDSIVGIKNSLFYSFFSTIVNTLFGTFIAYVIAKKTTRFYNAIDSIVMIPLFLPGIVLAFGYIMTYLDTPIDSMKNPTFLLIVAYSIRYIPYTIRSCVAGLQQMNPNLEEVSAVFGVSPLYTFLNITIPIILPSLIAGGLLSFSHTMLEVSESLLLASKERYYPITKVIYFLYSSPGDGIVKASALGVMTMIIISSVIFFGNRLMGKKMSNLFKRTS